MRSPWLRRVLAAGVMLVGTGVVLSGVVYMNDKGIESPKANTSGEVNF